MFLNAPALAFALAWGLLVPCSTSILKAAVSVPGAPGITVSVADSGSFSINVSSPAWKFGGTIGQPPANLAWAAGNDNAGAYNEIVFDYNQAGRRHASIRAYTHRRAVLFSVRYNDASDNAAPFPVISSYPAKLGHLTYTGAYAIT